MNRIALVRISDMNYMPIGLMYIAGALKKAGFEVKIFHYLPTDLNRLSQCAQDIFEFRPMFVGFSVLTVETGYAAALSKEIKKRGNITIIWGGIHPTFLPEQSLREEYIDLVILGEGEETIVELSTNFYKKDFKKIKGIGFKEDGTIVINPQRELIENLDDYRMDFESLNMERYLRKRKHAEREMIIVTSRGCFGKCGFCYNQIFNKRIWRAHSIDYVAELILGLKSKYKIDSIVYFDDNFFVNKERALTILKEVNIFFRAEIRVDMVTEDLIEQLSRCRCREIMFGWESGNDRILDLIDKGFTTQRTLEAMKILRKFSNITVSGSGIVGFPTETKREVKNTVDFALRLIKSHPKFMTVIGTFMPYPGTALSQLAFQEGWRPPTRTEEWSSFCRYWAHRLDLQWLRWCNKKNKKWLDYIYKYIVLCSRYYTTKDFPFWKTLIGRIFYLFSYFRLKSDIYFFPLEKIIYYDVWINIKLFLERRKLKIK